MKDFMDLESINQLNHDYQRVEQAIRYVEDHYLEQPSLKEMAQSVDLSEYHFQRLFSRWVGISPKRFMQYLTKEQAKQLLMNSQDILSTTFQSGLSGPGRLHDLFVTCEAVTPGEFKGRGVGVSIRYGFHPTPFGECMIATTRRGVCNLMFLQEGDRSAAITELRDLWPSAEISHDPDQTSTAAEEILNLFQLRSVTPLHLYLRGTNFQIKVWEALLKIPSGSVVSYEDIAVSIGSPASSRAVGNAVAHNPIPVLIPCHRVIRKSGEFGDYRWGSSRKKAMLGWELSKRELARQDSEVSVGV
jgi:AraC family transcriptional regulator of adaptative response/methylated-DNA-[protein]-cysteine methyltransferase